MKNRETSKTIRIFISSTFRDLQAERELLIKKVFPRLRQMGFNRGVDVYPIDLRWGITEDEAKNGKILEYCLKEIEDSKPFFIGIIGERYGWVPSEKDVSFDENGKYNWVYDELRKGRSITDIEIRYGALYNSYASNANFYIKDCQSEDRMEELKEDIRKSGLNYHEYKTLEELADLVENDFKTYLNELTPERKMLNYENLESPVIWWCSSKLKGYIDRPYDLPVEKIINTRKIWAFIGPAGSGKSAILSKFSEILAEKYKKQVIYCPLEIMNPYMSDCMGVKESIVRYIRYIAYRRLCSSADSILPYESDASFGYAFSSYSIEDALEYFPNDKPIIILDQLDILSDKETELDWLPNGSATIIVAARRTSTKILHSLKRKGANIVNIDSPDVTFRKKFITYTLNDYGKHLQEDLLHKIVDAPIFNNLVALRTILDELVYFGKHEDLPQFIEHYVKSENISDFYSRFWTRIHNDFPEIDWVVGLIALSQSGISEYELLDLTGINQLELSRLRATLYRMITSTGPRLQITDNDIIKSVLEFNQKKTAEWRNILFEYFKRHADYERSLMECSYQAYMMRNAKNLHTLLCQITSFETLERRQPNMLERYWKYLDAEGYDIEEYLEHKDHIEYFNKIGDFIRETSISRASAIKFYEKSISYYESINHDGEYDSKLGYLYINMAYLCREQNMEYDTFLNKATSMNISDRSLATMMIAKGIQYMDKELYVLAEECLNKACCIYKKLSEISPERYTGKLGRAYNNLSNALDGQNKIEDAITAAKKAVHYLHQGYVLDTEYEESLFTAYQSLIEKIESTHQYEDACHFCSEALEIFDKTNYPSKHFRLLMSYAELLHFLEKYNESIHAASDAAEYFRNTNNKISLMLSLSYIGGGYRYLDETKRMIEPFNEAVSIYCKTDIKSLTEEETLLLVKASFFLPGFLERLELNLSPEEKIRRYSISIMIYENLFYIRKNTVLGGWDEHMVSERLGKRYYQLACIYKSLGNKSKSLELYNKTLSMNVDNEYRLFAYISLTEYYDDIGDLEKVRQYGHMAIQILVTIIESSYGFGRPFASRRKRKLENILSILNKYGEHIEYDSLVKGPPVPQYRPVPYRQGRPYGFCTKYDSIWSWRTFCLKSASDQQLTDDIYCEIGNFAYGRAVVAINRPRFSTFEDRVKYGFIDVNGNVVIPIIYLAATEFHYGRAAVYDGKNWFYIDPNGKRII